MVSVVIPAYNRGFCIMECLESVLVQTYRDFEIIVVDDCSTDDTRERIAGLGSPKIRYIRNAFNQGAAGARNTGAAAATGEYIAFQDSDDLWLPDKLRLQMEQLEKTGSDLNFCSFSLGDGEYLTEIDRQEIEKLQPHLFAMLLVFPFIATPSVVCRKSCFDALGGFDTKLRCFEDYDFSLRFAEKYKISYLDIMLVSARRLDAGVNAVYDEKFKTMCLLFEWYLPQIAEHGLVERWVSQLSALGRHCGSALQAELFAKIKASLQKSM